MLEPPQRLRGAIVRGNLAITKRLLARFPELWLNIDPNNKGWCNLHYASFHGNYLVCFHLVLLMNHKRHLRPPVSDIDLITFDNLTVLHMPLKNHHSQTLHFLLQEFSGHRWIDRPGGVLLRTPLHYCCVYHFAEGLKLLLEFGADWTIQDANGDTCLHLCFAYDHIEGLEELVRFAVSRRLKLYMRDMDEPSDTDQPPNSALSLQSLPREKIREAVQDELAKLEDITNNRGWRAEDYAATFAMASRYNKIKESWIDRAVDEELALRQPLELDSALSMYIYDPMHDRRTKLSLNSLASLSNNGEPMANSLSNSWLTGNDAGVLSSPIQLIMQPFSTSSRHNSFHDASADASPRIDSQILKDSGIGDGKVRQHSRSLPLAQPGPVVERLPQSRKRSNTSFAPGNRPPPLPMSRTPTLQPGAMTPQPQTPTLMEILKADLAKMPSLKSFTISPLVRLGKRTSRDDLPPDVKLDSKPSNLYLDSANSSTLSFSAGNSAAVTPTTTRSQFSFSPLRFTQRRRSASTSNHYKIESPIAPAARAAAEAAVRSKGSTVRLQGTDKTPLNYSPALKRNASTPIINTHSHSIDNGPSRRISRRQSIAEVPRASLQNAPVLELPTADDTLETIDLSAMLIEDSNEVKHRFTVPILEDSQPNLAGDVGRPLDEGSISGPPVLNTEKEPLTPPLRRPSLSQHSNPLGGSTELRGSGAPKGLVKNVSSISFTRVRDE